MGFENEQTAQVIVNQGIAEAANYRRSESRLISNLMKLAAGRLYKYVECKSLRVVAISKYGLSPDVAETLITIARKCNDIPELFPELQAGRLTLSNARMILPILKPDNQAKWISSACLMSKRQLQKEIAKEFPRQAPVEESLRYVSAERLQLKCGVSEKLSEQIRRVQDLESSRQSKPVNIEGAIEAAICVYLDRLDPLEKALRAQKRANRHATTQRVSKPVPPPEKPVPPKKIDPHFIPAALKHAVTLRDGDQCTRPLEDGSRCPERRWLDTHHVVPIYLGGKTELDNLTTLCKSCHSWLHWQAGTPSHSHPRTPVPPE